MRRDSGLVCAALAAALTMVLAGCATSPGPPATAGGTAPARSGAGESVSELQVQRAVMEMADDYIAALGEAIYLAAEDIGDDREARKLAQSFLRNGVGAALDIATHPRPEISIFDMVVLVSLQSWAFEKHWIPAGIGEEAGAAAASRLREAETAAWRRAAIVLSGEQLAELRRLVEAWIASNPDRTVVSFVRFDEFLDAEALPGEEERGRASRLLQEWRATVSAVEDAILFGERALWFAGRYPYVLGEQVELTAYRLADQPEYEDFERAIGALETLSRGLAGLDEGLPEEPLREFEAALQRLGDRILVDAFERLAGERRALLVELEAREGTLVPLLAELRGAIDATSTLALRLDETLGSSARLLDRFPRASGPEGETLDLELLRQTVSETGRTIEQLSALLETADETLDSPDWDARLEQAERLSNATIDRAFWRVLILLLVFLAGLGLVLRWPGRPASRTPR